MSNSAAKRGRPRVLTDEQRKERARQRLRKWRLKHPGYNAESCAKQYVKNREKRLAYAAEYYARKKEEAAHD